MKLENLWGPIVSIFFLFNSIGQIPLFLSLLSKYNQKKQFSITLRELIFALFILLSFVYFGPQILKALDISQSTIGIVGGVLLFLISLDLIFPKPTSMKDIPEHEPFIVPLAMPGLAGPGTIAALMVLSDKLGSGLTALSLFAAWFPSCIILLSASIIKKWLGQKGLVALERFGGMLIALIGLQMLSRGIVDLVKENFF